MSAGELVREWVYGARIPGIIWLAGYPRSGVTMARCIFARCFGLMTTSITDESGRRMGYDYVVNPVPRGLTAEAIARLARRQGILPIKTHDYPMDHEPIPTLMVVRDGRRVLTSLKHFYQDKRNLTVTMDAMIRGDHPWGNWSAWIRAWARTEATTCITHEQMVNNLPEVVGAIATRFGLDPICAELPGFEKLHKSEPDFFREGKAEGRGDMTDMEEDLFWSLHGDVMANLGYER